MYKFTVFPGNNQPLLAEALLRRGNWEEIDSSSFDIRTTNLVWKPTNLPIRHYSAVEEQLKKNPNRLVLINHLENNRLITTKTGLIRQLRAYYIGNQSANKFNYSLFQSTPTTYLITVGDQDREWHQFQKRFNQIEKGMFMKEKIPAKHLSKNLWLLKPANWNQGRGIQVSSSMKQITHSLNSKPINSLWVIQKYVQRPLLYDDRKFDIRVWVVLTQKREVFIYTKAYMRTSSDKFTYQNNSSEVHLTNNCLQKHCQNYSKYEPGNTLPLQTLEEYLRATAKYKDFKLSSIYERMQDLVIDTIQSSKMMAFLPNKRIQFQLLGYDFIIDQDLRTWLIEVNVNPYLGVPNDYIKELLPKMVDDMFRIVVDPVFPPVRQTSTLPNDFKLILSDKMSLRASFSSSMYPIQELAQPSNRRAQQRLIKEPCVCQVIQHILNTSFYLDITPFQYPVSKLLSKIVSWELISEQELLNCLATLNLIAKSKVNFILLQPKQQDQLLKILSNSTFPSRIHSQVLTAFSFLLKDSSSKRKLDSRIFKAMIQLGVQNAKDEGNSLAQLILKILGLATINFSKTFYIPGETRDIQNLKNAIIESSGLHYLVFIDAISTEDAVKSLAKTFLSNLEIGEWQLVSKSPTLQSLRELSQKLEINYERKALERIADLKSILQRQKSAEKAKLEQQKMQEQRQQDQKLKRAQQKKAIIEEYIKRKRAWSKLKDSSLQNIKEKKTLKRPQMRNQSVNNIKQVPTGQKSEERYKIQAFMAKKRIQQLQRRKLEKQHQQRVKDQRQKRKEKIQRKYQKIRSNLKPTRLNKENFEEKSEGSAKIFIVNGPNEYQLFAQ